MSPSHRFARYALERPAALIGWTIIIGTLIRLVCAGVIGVGNGESYYLATARHLAWSYVDQPPLFLWIVWATMKLTGSEWIFVLRLPFVLMFVATTWLMYRLGAELFGERAGALAAFILNISPVFTVSVAGWMQPDGPLMLTLLAATLCIARIAYGEPRLALWAAAGFWFGLAMLAKYHAALAFAGLVVFALTSPAHRRWFAEPGPYLAALIAAVMFAPVLIWNWQTDWASFQFQGGRIVESEGIRPDWLLRSLLGQAAWIGPWIWLPMIYAYALALRRGPKNSKHWLLCCLATIPIVLFTVAALWAPLGWHFHWQAPGYLLLFPILGELTERRLETDAFLARPWLLGSTVAMLAIVAVLATHAPTGWIRALTPDALAQRLAHVQDPTLEGLDWSELRRAIARRGLLDKPRLFVVGPQWHQTGKVDVQLGKHLPVVCLCQDPRNLAYGWNPRDFSGWDALIIGTQAYIPDVQRQYGPYFRKIELLERVDIYRGGQVMFTVNFYYGADYHQPYPVPFGPGKP